MSRLQQVDPVSATGKAKDLLDGVKAKLGVVPNLTKVMANEPAVLEAYLGITGALSAGSFDAKTREAIALAVAGANGCDYCSSAHGYISRSLKVEEDEIVRRLNGSSNEPQVDALLTFVGRVVESAGKVSDADIQAARDAGLDDGAIAEAVAHVAANVFTNYLNNVADTDIDFPLLRSGTSLAA